MRVEDESGRPYGTMVGRGGGMDVLDSSGPFAGDVLPALPWVFLRLLPTCSCLSCPLCLLVPLGLPLHCLLACPLGPLPSLLPQQGVNDRIRIVSGRITAPFLSLPLHFLFHLNLSLPLSSLTPYRPVDSLGLPWAPYPPSPLFPYCSRMPRTP